MKGVWSKLKTVNESVTCNIAAKYDGLRELGYKLFLRFRIVHSHCRLFASPYQPAVVIFVPLSLKSDYSKVIR